MKLEATWSGFLALLLGMQHCPASTAAFQGTVTEVRATNQKDSMVQFTCKIEYFDYISWGKFNSASKTGELITRRVKKRGTAVMIDGRLVNVETFSKAIQPGQWGYFYEDTWLDLRTTPKFHWGEVVETTPAQRSLRLRVHQTHKQIHLEANPPQVIRISYAPETQFRLESEKATSKDVLIKNAWVQVHPARDQIIHAWSTASKFDPAELLPQAQGQRGFANDLTRPVVLLSGETEAPQQVIDLSCGVMVRGKDEDNSSRRSIACRKTSFILDGKLCPAGIALRGPRHAILGYYRKEQAPHKIFVESRKDALRGIIRAVSDGHVTLQTADGDVRIPLAGESEVRLDGIKSTHAALRPGQEMTVYPKRPPTIISFGTVAQPKR